MVSDFMVSEFRTNKPKLEGQQEDKSAAGVNPARGESRSGWIPIGGGLGTEVNTAIGPSSPNPTRRDA